MNSAREAIVSIAEAIIFVTHLHGASNYLGEASKFRRDRENRFRRGYGCRWRSEKFLNVNAAVAQVGPFMVSRLGQK